MGTLRRIGSESHYKAPSGTSQGIVHLLFGKFPVNGSFFRTAAGPVGIYAGQKCRSGGITESSPGIQPGQAFRRISNPAAVISGCPIIQMHLRTGFIYLFIGDFSQKQGGAIMHIVPVLSPFISNGGRLGFRSPVGYVGLRLIQVSLIIGSKV